MDSKRFINAEIWSDNGTRLDGVNRGDRKDYGILYKRPSFIPRKHRGKLITRLIVTVHGSNKMQPINYVATYGGYPNCHHVIYDYDGGFIHEDRGMKI